MFPIFNTIEEGGRAAAGFVRRYRWMALGFFAAYFAAAAIGVSGIVRLPMPLWLASLLADMAREAEAAGGDRLASIFFGGGTPSLMPPASKLAAFSPSTT